MMDRGRVTSAALAFPLSASGAPIKQQLRQHHRVSGPVISYSITSALCMSIFPEMAYWM